jgi:hypothetical protein
MTITEKELTLKAAPAEAPRLDARAAAPSRVTVATAESLGLTMDPQLEVPDWAHAQTRTFQRKLVAKVEEYLAKMDAKLEQDEDDPAELGEVTSGPYVGLDVVSSSPRQQITLPPYNPSRIIAAGESAVITAVVFINPAVDVVNGFAIPANVQLANRPIRIRLEQIDLTNLVNGPDFTASGVLPSPAPTLIFVDFPFVAADPGVNPALFEANVTVDIGDPVQPWAAMATRHLSRDGDPGFLGLPPEPPNQLLNNIPNPYLVYRR